MYMKDKNGLLLNFSFILMRVYMYDTLIVLSKLIINKMKNLNDADQETVPPTFTLI